jgi:hypothetical protein
MEADVYTQLLVLAFLFGLSIPSLPFLFCFLGCIVMRGWSAYVSNGLERRRVGGVGWDGVSIVFLK